MPLMANKSPKHDFAPAWLKIPEDGGVPGKLRHTLDHPPGRPRRDEFYGGFPRFGGPGGPPDFYNGPLQRHGSYDNYERPRFSGPKMRHHSLDDDYYGYGGYPMPHPPPFYNEYPSNGFKGPNIRGQPPMFRGNADKYMHPNSRFASPNINGKYNPHYDNYYDGYHNDYYHPSSGRPPRGRSMYNESRSNKENRHVRNGTDKEEEFPSLNGDSSTNENQSGKRSQLSGAWENPPNKSQTSNNSPKRLPPESTNGMSPSGRIYKAVVPNKVLTRKLSKEAMMENFLKDKENQPKTINNNNNKASHKTNGVNGTSNHSKNEDNLDRVFTRKQSEPLLINGMSQLCVSNDESSLSSSLEAEQRLLREMGWTDTDEDDYEITEEEMKAFYDDLSKQGKAGKQNSVCAPAPSTNGTSVSGSNSLSNGTSNGESNGLSNGIVTDVTDLTDTDGENDAT